MMAAEFILPLFGSVAAFTLLTLINVVFDDLSDFNGAGFPFPVMALYFLARVPPMLITVLPVSALLGVCFMTMVLRKNNELTAIRAAGLSLFSTAIPVYAIALLLCGGAFALKEYAEPAGTLYVERIRSELDARKEARKTAAKENKEDKANDRKKGKKAKGESPAAPGLSRQVGKDAKPAKGGKTAAKSKKHLAFHSERFRRDWFFLTFSLQRPCIGVRVREFNAAGETTSILTAQSAEYLPQTRQWRFSHARTIEYRYQNGVPSVQMPQDYPELLRDYHEIPQDIAAQSRPIKELDLARLLRLRRKRGVLTPQYQRLADACIANRCTAPFATLIAVLLGFALTITPGRKSVLSGFLLAIGGFMAYYLLAEFAVTVGERGLLNPWVAGALPTILALIIAVAITWRRQ